MSRTRILSLAIFFITAGVMIILTVVRYNDRIKDRNQAGGTVAAGASGDLHEIVWDELPTVDSFKLTERSGREVSSDDYPDDALLISFFFTSCPSICREQNNQIAQLAEGYRGKNLKFMSITCDPENDSPVRLREYAKTFQADEEQWLFLTGEFENLKQISEGTFQTALSTTTHGTNLMLVDKWGRLRDRFDWQQPEELLRLRIVLDSVVEEQEPPKGQEVSSRIHAEPSELMSGHGASLTKSDGNDPDEEEGYAHGDWREQDWIEEFTLTERSGETFSTDELDGKVWVGSFFFSSCPTICKQQNNHIAELMKQMGDRDVTFISITTDPENDTPQRLREYAKSLDADENKWLFLTGERLHIRRIAGEFFESGFMNKENHTTALVLLDKWGEIRGKYDWNNPEELVDLRIEVDRLLVETKPPAEGQGSEDDSP